MTKLETKKIDLKKTETKKLRVESQGGLHQEAVFLLGKKIESTTFCIEFRVATEAAAESENEMEKEKLGPKKC